MGGLDTTKPPGVRVGRTHHQVHAEGIMSHRAVPVNPAAALHTFAARLRRRRVVRYSADSPDVNEYVTLGEVAAQVGDDVARRLAVHFTHTGLDGQPVIATGRLADLLELEIDRRDDDA
jgi:hypothetical protein